jgi:hypothetical protein
MQVDANAHEQLHGAKREVKGACEQAQVLRAQVKVGLQGRGHEGGDRAIGLAERKRARQRKQHDPDGWQRRAGFHI